MRSILSFAVLTSIVFSALGPVFGQRLMRQPSPKTVVQSELKDAESKEFEFRRGKPVSKPERPKPGKSPKKTEFGKVEAFSDGNGAWVRWRMAAEVKNVGFQVYRLDPNGEVPVSEIVLGAAYRVGGQEPDGGYSYFDPNGSQEVAYAVETISEGGKNIRTGYLVPEYVESIDSNPDGKRTKSEALGPKAGDSLLSPTLNVSSELRADIQFGLYQANPTRHREVISTPGGVKIASKSEGVVRVTKGELQGGGFDVNSNSGNWQLYCEGVELPMIIGPNADYIEFLGRPIDTLESNIRTYYLIPGASAGRRIEDQPVRRPVSTAASRKYNQTFVREDQKIYLPQILNGAAENWFGDSIGATFVDYKFNLSGIDRTAGTRKLKLELQGLTLTPHSVELTLNGTVLPNATGLDRLPLEAIVDVPVSALLDGQNTLRMRSVGLGFGGDGKPISGDISVINRISIDFPRSYTAMDNKLKFYTDNYRKATVSGFTSPDVRVFDVTFENTPRVLTGLEIVQTNGTWGPIMPAGRGQVLYAVEGSVLGSALSVMPNDPSILTDPANAGTLVIISHPSLMTEATAWADYRRRPAEGIVTKVVDVTDIYDEYSYGVLNSQAIEDFLNYAKNNWQTPPSYVLLMGDGHYDSKNYDSLDPGLWNMVPARYVDTIYLETGSDDALSDFNDDGLAEIPIGRIAARDGASVMNVLNKTMAWEASLNANSMNRGVLFAHDWPDGYDFHALSDRLMAKLPPSVPTTSISQTTAGAQASIIAAINELDGGTAQAPGANAGQYLLNYTGHGTTTSWRNTNFFSAFKAPNLTNATYPSLMISLTCLNGYFMNDFDSFSEAMTKIGTGGAPAVWASTGETTPDVQEIMAERFYTKIGEGNITRLGDLINDAKVPLPAQADVRLSWALIGDPMLKVR